jgi:cyclopropane-fatty-acyl-phospholipid synthase
MTRSEKIEMENKSLKQNVQKLLDRADVQIDGQRPWDIRVNNEELYTRILAGGILAVGEAYMDGWWDCDALDQLIDRILRVKWDLNKILPKHLVWDVLKARLINQQRKSQAYVIGERHYDTGNELFQVMLDKRMNYSCGYWKNAKNLDKSQEDKLDLICKKLKLKPGTAVLDIGCGWGSLAKYAVEKFQSKVTGITVSKEQVRLAGEMCQGLDVEIRYQDYRDLTEKFDSIVSVGMFEHVGYKNYREFFKVVDRCLKDKGLFLLHTIGGNQPTKSVNPWINKYIFPNGMLPSASQITKSYEGLFKLEDWHNFGTHYDKTLMAWHRNFNQNWDRIRSRYDERFRRMWNYYLLTCAGAFRARQNQLWQIVLSKIDSPIDYDSIR